MLRPQTSELFWVPLQPGAGETRERERPCFHYFLSFLHWLGFHFPLVPSPFPFFLAVKQGRGEEENGRWRRSSRPWSRCSPRRFQEQGLEHDGWPKLQAQALEAEHGHRYVRHLPCLHPHRHEICGARATASYACSPHTFTALVQKLRKKGLLICL